LTRFYSDYSYNIQRFHNTQRSVTPCVSYKALGARKRAFIFNPYSIAILNQPCRVVGSQVTFRLTRSEQTSNGCLAKPGGLASAVARNARVLGAESPLAVNRTAEESAWFDRVSLGNRDVSQIPGLCRTDTRRYRTSDNGTERHGQRNTWTLHAAKSRDHDPAPEKPPGHRSADRGKDSPVKYMRQTLPKIHLRPC